MQYETALKRNKGPKCKTELVPNVIRIPNVRLN